MAFGLSKKGDGTSPSSKNSMSASGPSAGSSKNVSLSRILSEKLIIVSDNGLSKDKLIEHLVRELCVCRNLGDSAPFLSKVLEREKGISTTLDTGLAVPHARMDNLSEIAAVLALLPKGMADPKQPDLTIRAMFLFFSPNRQEAFTQHLHLLRGVSSMFQPAFIDEILKAENSAAVLRLIVSQEPVV